METKSQFFHGKQKDLIEEISSIFGMMQLQRKQYQAQQSDYIAQIQTRDELIRVLQNMLTQAGRTIRTLLDNNKISEKLSLKVEQSKEEQFFSKTFPKNQEERNLRKGRILERYLPSSRINNEIDSNFESRGFFKELHNKNEQNLEQKKFPDLIKTDSSFCRTNISRGLNVKQNQLNSLNEFSEFKKVIQRNGIFSGSLSSCLRN